MGKESRKRGTFEERKDAAMERDRQSKLGKHLRENFSRNRTAFAAAGRESDRQALAMRGDYGTMDVLPDLCMNGTPGPAILVGMDMGGEDRTVISIRGCDGPKVLIVDDEPRRLGVIGHPGRRFGLIAALVMSMMAGGRRGE